MINEIILNKNVMISVGEENFRCPRCQSNVFTKVQRENGDIVYRCHGCQTEYIGDEDETKKEM